MKEQGKKVLAQIPLNLDSLLFGAENPMWRFRDRAPQILVVKFHETSKTAHLGNRLMRLSPRNRNVIRKRILTCCRHSCCCW